MNTKQKMYATHKKTGRKVFCIALAHPFSGLMHVKFFVPTSIYVSSPDLKDSKYFYKVFEERDKREKTIIVDYLVHPSCMLGTSFPVEYYKNSFQVAEELINQFELEL